MFCKSLCYKGFYVEIKKARTRGLDGRRNKNWGGTFRSAIRLLRRRFKSPTMPVFINWNSLFLRLPASKHDAVNENCPPCYIKSSWNKTRPVGSNIFPAPQFSRTESIFHLPILWEVKKSSSKWKDVPPQVVGGIRPTLAFPGPLSRRLPDRTGYERDGGRRTAPGRDSADKKSQ